MSTSLDIRDAATPLLRGMLRSLRDTRAVNRAAAEGALPVLQRHFLGLSQSNQNRFGARSSFWGRMISATRAVATDQSAALQTGREVGLRFFGGQVVPRKAKYLAIPAHEDAYGKSPRQFNDLHAISTPNGLALVQNTRSTIKRGRVRKDGTRKTTVTESGGGVMFWLVRSATIRPNPAVLPTDAQLIAGALAGVRTYADTRAARAAQGGSAS